MSPFRLSLLLLAPLALVACNSGSHEAEQAASAAAQAQNAAAAAAQADPIPPPIVREVRAAPSEGVTGFQTLSDGGRTTTVARAGGSRWTMTAADTGEQLVITETGRAGCCISFTWPDGKVLTADFVQEFLYDDTVSVQIRNVAR